MERFQRAPLRLSEQVLDQLLWDLCVELGYCLSPTDEAVIVSDPPTDPRRFAELVMELEVGGPGDSEMFEAVLERVCRAFLKEAGESA